MRNRLLARGAALCGILLAFAGCDNGSTFQDAKTAGVKGLARVIVDDGTSAQTSARTALPLNAGFAYTLSFSASGKTAVTASMMGNIGEVLLDEGNWTLNVSGAKSGYTVAESGAIAVAMNGDPVTVNVAMRPVLNGDDGAFRYNVTAAEGLTEVAATLSSLDIGEGGQSEISLTADAETRSIALAPGYYWMTVTARKGEGQRLIRREVVHIYSNTVTTKTYTLAVEDFGLAVYLAGTLTGDIPGYSPAAVIAYSDAACAEALGQGAVNGRAWNMEAEGAYETVYFRVRLEKNGSAAYYSEPVAASGVPTAGKTDIELQVRAGGLDDLASSQYGNSANNPVLLIVSESLADNGLASILSAINDAGKYVALDLSACAMSGTEFDPGTSAGADKVTDLILPDAARSVTASGYYNSPTFRAFINLKSISGASIETVGDYAFWGCSALESVSLPAATSIGDYALQRCSARESVRQAVAN
jgi:hypothetical protein